RSRCVTSPTSRSRTSRRGDPLAKKRNRLCVCAAAFHTRGGRCGDTGVAFLQSAPMTERLKRLIRDIPDFPKPGIHFRDITPLLADPSGLALAVELLANPYRGKNIDLVVGAESRGFIFGTAVACCLSAGFVIVRKPGKLPHARISMTYDLEYGKDTLEMHSDAIVKGQRVLIVD